MTTPGQFTQDVGDTIAVLVIFCAVVGLLTWWLERRARRERRKPEILPPPDIPRYRNVESIAEWRRKTAHVDLNELDKNHGAPR